MAQITKIKLQLKHPELISKLHFALSLLLPLNRLEAFKKGEKKISTTEGWIKGKRLLSALVFLLSFQWFIVFKFYSNFHEINNRRNSTY